MGITVQGPGLRGRNREEDGELEGGEGRDFAEEGEFGRAAHAFETHCHARVLPMHLYRKYLDGRVGFVPKTLRRTKDLYRKPLDGRDVNGSGR